MKEEKRVEVGTENNKDKDGDGVSDRDLGVLRAANAGGVVGEAFVVLKKTETKTQPVSAA